MIIRVMKTKGELLGKIRGNLIQDYNYNRLRSHYSGRSQRLI